MEKRGLMIGCYLLVELVNIVGGLVLGLNEDWVLLYSLSCGHIVEKDGGCCKRERVHEKGSNALMTRVCFRPKRQHDARIPRYNHGRLPAAQGFRSFLLISTNLITFFKGSPLFPASFCPINSNKFTTYSHSCLAHPHFRTGFLLFNVGATINHK